MNCEFYTVLYVLVVESSEWSKLLGRDVVDSFVRY